MQQANYSIGTFAKDLQSGMVVFLVALPLCLGIAIASGAPPFAGILAGIIGGILVGAASGSHTSVSGPAAGLAAVVAIQIGKLGSFEAFLLAVIVAGVLQIALGLIKAGNLAAFFPSSVIKGLLAAIGVILILKQVPHLLGHDRDPEGDMAFLQTDKENTFSELFSIFSGDVHQGAIVIGIFSLVCLIAWDQIKALKKLVVPAPLLVVIVSVGITFLFKKIGGAWEIPASHLVAVPVAGSFGEFFGFLRLPDFSAIGSSPIIVAGITLALVASLLTLLNVEAVDRIDPKKRYTPPSRELVAQGIGNIVSGFIGGLPITSVIIRGSVNLHSGCQTKMSTIFHGTFLLICVALFPALLNMIPVASLAAILLVTGFKLVSPSVITKIIKEGRHQYVPFFVTLFAIVFTDLLYGVMIGLGVSLFFILNSNLRRPQRRILEKHVGGEVSVIELANQVSFLNRAALESALRETPDGTHLVIDAHRTDYIDPDIVSLIQEFKTEIAPLSSIKVSFRGFKAKYELPDEIQDVHVLTKVRQQAITPEDALQLLKDGSERFSAGQLLSRDPVAHISITSKGQHPFAVVLSCIDSRAPVETIFDLGLGDVFSTRIAGNVISEKVLGSMEYGCAVAGAKMILVLGHSRCGAVAATVDFSESKKNVAEVTGCQHLETIVDDIRASVDAVNERGCSYHSKEDFVEEVAKQNIVHSVESILQMSRTINQLVEANRIGIIGGKYDVSTGKVEFYHETARGFNLASLAEVH